MTAGRPLKFQDPIDLQKKIDEYFKIIYEKEDVATVSALAVHLNSTRLELLDYENRVNNTTQEISTIFKKAKARILAEQEQMAMKGKINPTVWIFSSKNNLGYVDRTETDHKISEFNFFKKELNAREVDLLDA